MRISLIKPPSNGILGLELVTFTEPLGLEYVAGALETAGHACQIVDMRIDGVKNGMNKLRKFAPDIAGIQCNFTTERINVVSLAKQLKQEFAGIVTLAGGHDASRDPEWFINPAIDAVAIGDGEQIIRRFVEACQDGTDLRSVPGLMINTSSGPVYTDPAPACEDINQLPLPARHLIKDYSDDYYMSLQRPLALLETARGCPFRCNFCSVWKFHNGRFREKSVQRVMQELRQIDAPYVFITDDIFWVNRKRSVDLATAIIDSGIRKHFFIQTRTDIVVKCPDLIELWKGCGKISVFLGLEKVDDEGLASVNKKNSAENNDKAIEVLRNLGVGYTPNFIVDPEWDKDDFAKLHRWLERTGAYNSGFSILTPLPGTDLWNDIKDRLTTDDWELFDLEHAVLPTKLPLDEFYAEYAGLWKHALELRYKERGKLGMYTKLLAGLALRKVTLSAVRKGLMIGKVMGNPENFLKAHHRLSASSQPSKVLPAIQS